MLQELPEKVKSKIKPFYTLILILVLITIFFALGRLSAIESKKTPIKIEYANQEQSGAIINSAVSVASSTANTLSAIGEVIGSKSGKKYYFPWCGTVKRIKPENQVHFASIDEAKKAGFVAGGNCKGLQ